MIIKGIQKLSMVDYPGLICTTLFTPGCNMRCPFCHNSSLVVGEQDDSFIDLDELFVFLESRKKKVDAVCLTGGEPLLQSGVAEFLLEVKKMGFKTKLDTNGTRPAALARVLETGGADYVAMDLKNGPEEYARTVGLTQFDIAPILQSIDLLLNGCVDYEFRTTVSATLHTKESLMSAGELIRGAKRWYLQAFKPGETVIDQSVKAFSKEELCALLTALEGFADELHLRGI